MRVNDDALVSHSRVPAGEVTACSRIPRSRTFLACSIRSTGFRSRSDTAGMCCWMPRRSCRPTVSTWPLAARLRVPVVLQDLRLSDRRWMSRRAEVGLAKLQRPWFAGGTITVASVQGDKFYLAEGESAFEDGTPNYLALPAVDLWLDTSPHRHRHHPHTRCVPHRVADRAAPRLQHIRTATTLARIYGPRSDDRRGGTVTFNLYDPEGRAIDHRGVETRANAADFAPHRLFLQSGRRRDRFRHHGHRAVVVLSSAGARDPADGRRLPAVHRRQEHGRVRVSLGLVERGRRRRVHRICPHILELIAGNFVASGGGVGNHSRCI